MQAHLLQAHALVRVGHQDLLAEVLRVVAERVKGAHGVVRLLQVEVRDVRVGVVLVLAREGRLPRQKLKAEDAHGPLVDFLVVGLLVDELGRHVVHRAAESRPPLVNGVRGPAEVTQFNMHRVQVGNQNIFRLDVPMDHVAVLQVEQRLDHLRYDMSCAILREALFSAQLLVKIAMLTVLEHHVNVLRIVEVAVKAYNIRMVQSPLNFKLAFHLAEEIKLLEHILENDLEGAWHTS